MAGKPKAERATGPAHEKGEPFLPESELLFTPVEIGELRAFFESSAWRKAVHNARLARPSGFPSYPVSATPELRQQLQSEELLRIQGWKLFEAALAKQVMPPEQRRRPVPDNFPDAGRIDAPHPQAMPQTGGALPPSATTIRHPAKKP